MKQYKKEDTYIYRWAYIYINKKIARIPMTITPLKMNVYVYVCGSRVEYIVASNLGFRLYL